MAKYKTITVTVRSGATVEVPDLSAMEGWAFGEYNFAGPGWNSSEGGMAARPVNTFDFAAKLHDLHYCISGIDFKTLGDHQSDVNQGGGNARDRSHQHKADVIFRVMVEHTDESGLGAYYSRTRFIHSRTDWAIPNDGFVNILTEPSIISLLKSYRMIPYEELPQSSQQRYRRNWFERHIHGPRNYEARVPSDINWCNWARAQYRGVWGRITGVS